MSFSINRTNNKIVKKTVSLTSNPTINTNAFEETYQVVSSTNSIITLPSNSNNTINYYNNWYIRILSGNGINQIRQIQSYNSINKQLTLKTNLDIIPSNNDSIILYNKLNSNIIWQESNNRFAPVFMKNSTNLNQMGETVEYLDFGCNNLTILSNKQSHSTTTGSLTVNGGAGITGTVNIGNNLNVTNSISCNSLSVNGISITGNLSNVYLTDIIPGTASISKALVLNGSGNISGINSLTSTNIIVTNFTLNGTLLTPSAAEINKLTGTTAVTSDFNKLASVTASATELNYLDLTSGPGTAENSKALVLNSSGNISGINNLTSNRLLLGTSTDSTVTRLISALDSTITTGNTRRQITLGKAASTNNQIEIAFNWIADGSSSNYMSLGLFGTSSIINILGNGNVGIGNTSPSYKLDVSGDINLTGSLRFNTIALSSTVTELNYLAGLTLGTITASKVLTVDSSSNINSILRLKKIVSGQQIYLENGTSTGTIYHDLNGSIYLGTISANDLIFQTQNTNRVTITSAGLMNIQGGWQISGTTVTANATKLNYLDITTEGTAQATKALILDNSSNLNSGINNFNISGILTIGTVGLSNRINFKGTTGDSSDNFTVISERIYSGTECSELLLFKGNDPSGTSGPDRIRMRASEFRFQTYTTAEDYSSLSDNNNRLFISNNGKIGINTVSPGYQFDVSGDINLTGSLRFGGIAVTATVAEINYLDFSTGSPGTAEANKALILNTDRDISNIRKITLNGTEDVITLSNSTTSARINLRFINDTKSWELGSRGSTASNSNSFYLYDNQTSSYRLIVDSDGDVNIVSHNGSTNGLQLNGTLVTATADELNYLDTTQGIGSASKALILNIDRDISNIRNLTATNLTGTLQTASQTNITSVGTLSSLTSSGNIIISNANAAFRMLAHSDNIIYLQAGLNTTAGSSADIFIGNYGQDIASSSRKIIFKGNGRLGLGTISPQSLLDFGQNATDSTINLYTHGTTNETFKIGANGSLIKYQSGLSAGHAWYTGSTTTSTGTESMRLNNLNALSVNTSNANAIMNILGSSNYVDGSYNRVLRCSGANASPVNIEIQCNSGSSATSTNAGWIGTVSNNDLRLGANASTFFTIKANGNIGINNTNPGYKLDINGSYWATGGEIHTGTNWSNNGLHHSAYGDDNVLYRLISKGYVSYPSGPFRHQFGATGNTSLEFLTNNSTRMFISNSGQIGIGTSSPGYPLHVTGGGSFSGSFIFYARSGTTSNSNIGFATGNSDTSIYASGRMTAGEFNAFSDSRIKKNITDINDISALNTLRLIQPKQYNYIDTLNKTSNPVFGFIAQQVSEVLDYSVNIITDYIPNIYQIAIKSLSENNDTVLSFNNSINYDSNGTGKIKLIDENDKIIYVTIKNKINNYSFSINETLENIEYFIYGEEVNNYHSLNKDSIFTITTAAVQEIDRIVIEQKNKITNLENENQQLKDQIQNILIRLQNLENN